MSLLWRQAGPLSRIGGAAAVLAALIAARGRLLLARVAKAWQVLIVLLLLRWRSRDRPPAMQRAAAAGTLAGPQLPAV